jgi:hypothetical protein
MSWQQFHSASEALAAEAELAMLNGDLDAADNLYQKAAEAETKALEYLDETKQRTFGITSVSAVSLLFKGKQFELAEKTAYKILSGKSLPEFAIDQIKSLLQSAWNEMEMKRAGLKFSPGQVLVAVRGGEIIRGGAPLDLVVEKVQIVQAYYYRTVEFLKHLPHRKSGPPDREIQEMCRPWLFQAVPSSYQFAVAVQEPSQTNMFGQSVPPAIKVASAFLSILKATINDPEDGLKALVPDEEYQSTFIKLTRNLAPTGKSFNEMEIKSLGEQKSVSLIPTSRESLNESIKKRKPPLKINEGEEDIVLNGVLRAVHLNKDWLEITVNGQDITVKSVGDAVDDIIGPMVNRPVIIKARKNKKGQYKFQDIEPEG